MTEQLRLITRIENRAHKIAAWNSIQPKCNMIVFIFVWAQPCERFFRFTHFSRDAFLFSFLLDLLTFYSVNLCKFYHSNKWTAYFLQFFTLVILLEVRNSLKFHLNCKKWQWWVSEHLRKTASNSWMWKKHETTSI